MTLSKFTTEDLMKEIQIRNEQERIRKQEEALKMRSEYEQKQKAANKEIRELISQAEECIHKATTLADKYGLYFSWNACGYGMGGGYQGVGEPDDDGWTPSDTGWQSSSQSC